MSEGFPGDAGGLLAGLVAGSLVGGYRLEKQVGAGGMAVVFRAVDERLGRRVALKVLAPAVAADAAFRQRFLRESRAAAAVDDPHIIPVYEAGEAGGVLFIAMRFVPGGDVRTLLHEQGPLSPDRAAAIISPVASALDAAHAAGLVHRDVKPANMLVDTRPDRPDHVYLSDFGLSKRALSSAGLTGTGQFLGTPDYMAPEQIEGRVVDGWADQYALACTAFELLCGEAPFRRDQGMAVLLAHLQQEPPSLASRRPGVPAAGDAVFARALAKVPADRYPTCREFADALRGALGVAAYHSGPDTGQAGQRPGEHPATEIAGPFGLGAGKAGAPATAAEFAIALGLMTDAEGPPTFVVPPQAATSASNPEPTSGRIDETSPDIKSPSPLSPDELISRPPRALATGTPPATGLRRRWLPSRRAGVIAGAGSLLVVVAIVAAILVGAKPGHATAYVGSFGQGTVTPIDLATRTLGVPIRVGNQPMAIAVAPDGKTAYVASFVNQSDSTVTPIDLATGIPATPIEVGPGANAIAITPDGRTAYVVESDGVVTPIDLAARTAGTPIDVARCAPRCSLETGLGAIAITPDGRTAFVTNGPSQSITQGYDTVMPINLATGTVGDPIPIKAHSILDAIAITPDGKTAYVANFTYDTVTPIDVATDTPGAPIQLKHAAQPGEIAITPDSKSAYVITSDNAPSWVSVTPIDLATRTPGPAIQVIRNCTVSCGLERIAITPDGRTAYVTAVAIDGRSTIIPIDLATGKPGKPIPDGRTSSAIAITP